MTSYRPASGQHAVEQAIIGVRIFQSASDADYQNAVTKAAELAVEHSLPGRMQLDPMSLVFGRQVISHGFVNANELMPGTLFQRVNSDGTMAEELTIERGAVTYRTRSYKRWKDVQNIVDGIVSPVVSILAQGDINQVAVIELRCVDRFTSDVNTYPRLSELVRNEARHVTSNLLNSESQLHIHSGWFEDATEDGRTLINLNIDVIDQSSGSRDATILQSISRHSSEAGSYFERGECFGECILLNFNELHSKDKSLLAGVLTDELQSQINLIGTSGIA